jgi:hypothetical protein
MEMEKKYFQMVTIMKAILKMVDTMDKAYIIIVMERD